MARTHTLTTPQQGRTIAVVGDVYRFLATGAETDGKYAMRRIAAVIPILLGVSFVVFALMNSLPGDPAINILGPADPQQLALG